MVVNFAALLAISYFSFVFVCDLSNPFKKTAEPLRKRRWRLGRAVAISSLLAGVAALFLLSLDLFNAKNSLVIYLVLATVFAAPAIFKYKKSAIWG